MSHIVSMCGEAICPLGPAPAFLGVGSNLLNAAATNVLLRCLVTLDAPAASNATWLLTNTNIFAALDNIFCGSVTRPDVRCVALAYVEDAVASSRASWCVSFHQFSKISSQLHHHDCLFVFCF